jgi:hypothetical protein
MATLPTVNSTEVKTAPVIDVLPVFSSILSESFPVLGSLRARSWNVKKSRYTDEMGYSACGAGT